MRTCKKCGSTDSQVKWVVRRGRNNGLLCFSCQSDKVKEWKRANKDKVNAQNKAWREDNPEKQSAVTRAWRKANPRRMTELKSEWYGNNPGKRQFHQISRKMAKENRTPKWADMKAIESLYAIASRMGWHVDHEIPLRGKLVSGLHVESNLRVIRPSENLSKGNKFNQEVYCA